MATMDFYLNINGTKHSVNCNPDDSLADILRTLGYMGVKVGCGTGQCGTCTVLVDDMLVRCCHRKMKNISENAMVETIEGIGTAENPHPLQQAFLTYAAVQCGFCSPGFIISAKALLNHCPSPTRQEVREWFTRNNNICRCTGYKPIIDAVMAAATVMRGEATMQDITFAEPKDGRIYGTDVPKPNGLAHVLGTCNYGADMALDLPDDALHLAMVLGRKDHALIEGIDTSIASTMPGVVKIITAKDVKGTNRLVYHMGTVRSALPHPQRPVICDDAVRRYGDVVAVVAAKTREQARAAAKEVCLNLKELPAVKNFMEAVAPNAPKVFNDMPNCYLEQPLYRGDDAAEIIKNSSFAVQGSFSTSRQPHLVLEPDCGQAYPQKYGGVLIKCKTQYPHGIIGAMADAIGLPTNKIRVIQNPSGGSFGYSMSAAPYALMAVCALALNCPVSLVMSYEEHQHFSGKRSPAYTNARMACDSEGNFTAIDYHVGVDHGAYEESAGSLTMKITRYFGYPYSLPSIRGLVQTACTNNNFGVQYRAFGSPQAYMASEQLVDMLAIEAGQDPFEIRYRNIAREGDMCPTSVPYREYPMQKIMDTMRPYYKKAVANAKQAHTSEKLRGVGLAWGGYHVGKSGTDSGTLEIELNPDGSITHYSCWPEMGQGAELGLLVNVHEAFRPFGLDQTQIHFVTNDTGICQDMGPAAGSRSFHVCGQATLDAASKLIAAMRKDDGSLRTWQEMHDEGLPTRYQGNFLANWGDLDPNTGHGFAAIGQNYMLTLTEVEVDANTGKTTVLKATIIADFGTVGARQGALGQAWGGFAHALGFALSENYEDMKKHSSLLGAGVVRCTDVPDDIEVLFIETPRSNGPHGSTGCAEGFQSAGHASILNAIANATGVRIYTLPASPQKVKAALDAKERGETLKQTQWNLGCDLYERLNFLKANPV